MFDKLRTQARAAGLRNGYSGEHGHCASCLDHAPYRVPRGTRGTFDLDEPGMLPWMYQIVLREAARTEDLAYLNQDQLIALWPTLFLPTGVRSAWEEQHPVLRAAAVPAA